MGLTDKFDEMNGGKKNNPEKQGGQPNEPVNYPTAGDVRNLCFVQPDGKRQFLNYAYLISGEYDPEASEIKLTYTTHVVALKGYNLEALFESLMVQVPKEIVGIDNRYSEESNEATTGVIEIIINQV